MKIYYGKHTNWRELSFRICNKKYGISKDEYFMEINLWFWFVTITVMGKNKFKKFMGEEIVNSEFTKEDFNRMKCTLEKYTTVYASGINDNLKGDD